MSRWTDAQMRAVLAELGPDLTPARWAALSGWSETEVRITLGIVAREAREALGWTVGMAAYRAGVNRAQVARVESGTWAPRAARDLWIEYRAEARQRRSAA